jgi:arylsulfatase A-like enzyme
MVAFHGEGRPFFFFSLFPAAVDGMSETCVTPLVGAAPWSRRLVVIAVAIFAGVLIAGEKLSAASRVADEGRPNIVFILADDLGYGDLGCYGQARIQTPELDRMAADGMRFTQFYAGSTVCAPSRCVLMTGRHTGRCYIRGNRRISLRPDDLTVAEVLKRTGYATALVGKWGLGQEGSDGVPNRQGFDQFFGYLDQVHAHNYYPTFLMRNEQRFPLRNIVPEEGEYGQGRATKRMQYSHDLFADEALSFIDANKERPFFLYFAATIPHANNEAGDKGMEIPDYGIYSKMDWPDAQKGLAAMISRLDRDVGRILRRLEQHGIERETIVFFSSDNGPHSEGGNDATFFDSNGPLRGMKRDLYEGGIRVPLVVRWPGHVPGGTVSPHVAYFGDFLATAAELAGVDLAAPTDGISFLPELLGEADRQPKHDYLYWEFYERGSTQAVRLGVWKGVVSPLRGEEIELYHLPSDPAEAHDIAAAHPDLLARIREAFSQAHIPSDLWKPRGR